MNREIREDKAIAKRLTRAALLFVVAMSAMAAVGLWIFASGNVEPANQAQSVALLVGLLTVFAAAINALIVYGRLRWNYRCPQCGARLPMVPHTDRVGSQIRYACETCDVEWSTGWTVAESD